MKKLLSIPSLASARYLAVGGTLLLAACSGEMGGGRGGPAGDGDSRDNPDGKVDGTGSVGGDGDVGPDGPPPPYEPAQGMLKRLTRPQFANAIREIFDFEVDTDEIDPDIHVGDFAAVGAAHVVTSQRGVEQYGTAVETAVDHVFSDPIRRTQFLGSCEPVGISDACVSDFLQHLARRAWRRPLDAEETDTILGVAQLASDQLGSVTEGLRWATIAIFSSVNFLYRPELGVASADGGLRLSGYETASRLAFLIWNGLPDDQLLDDAEDGKLDTVQGIRSAAQRLLEDPAGRESVGAFAEDYMRLDRVLRQAKDPILYPKYDAGLQKGMVEDVRGVWQIVAFDRDASVLDLFSTDTVLANKELASLYGLDATGLDTDTFKEFSLPADGTRSGILAKAGFLSQFANQKEGSPTLRGKFIREAIMCTPVEPPPGGVALDLKDAEGGVPMTKRQRLELHRASPVCANCHSNMDPLGLPFESFDAIGEYRTLDNGLPVDPSGEFDGVPVEDSTELGRVMSESETVVDCLVRKFYTYGTGHEERDVDEEMIQELEDSFQASGYRLKQLIVDLVGSRAFTEVAPQSD